MATNNNELFESTKASKAVWTLALPTIMAMIVTIIYNIADTFFIGQLGDTNQVAAISLAMPVFMIMMSFGTVFGTGGSTSISRNLGANDIKRAKNISSFSFYGAITVGLILAVLLFLLAEVITALLGGSIETSGFVISYLKYLAIGSSFIIVSNTFGSIVRSNGNAKISLVGMLIGTVTNIVLDPIFILVFDFGVAGAAIATVIGNIAATVYYIHYMRSDKTSLSISIKDLKMRNGIAKEVISIGVPGSLNSVLMSFAIMFMNVYLVNYGDIAVAAMGVAHKGNMIPAMLFAGFGMGAQPLLAYAYGANNKKRLMELISYCMKVSVLMGIVLTTVFMIIAPQIIRSFINEPEVINLGTRMLRAMISTSAFLGTFFISMTITQSMGKAGTALILTVCRQGIVYIPAIIILNSLFGLGGLIWSQPLADFTSVILAIYLVRKNLKQMNNIKVSDEDFAAA